MNLDELFELVTRIIPTDLVLDVVRPLRVLQTWPFDQEGPLTDSLKVRRALSALNRIAAGRIDERVPEMVRQLMKQALDTVGLETCFTHVFLYNAYRSSGLVLKYTDGSQSNVTWEQWGTMFTGTDGVALNEFGQDEKIKSIRLQFSYDSTVERVIHRNDIPEIVLTTIALTFDGNRTAGFKDPLIRDMVRYMDSIQGGFIFAVNYAEAMASYHQEDWDHFLGMAQFYVYSRQKYELAMRLRSLTYLNPEKCTEQIMLLSEDPEVFQRESVEEVFERIVAACTLPKHPFEEVLDLEESRNRWVSLRGLLWLLAAIGVAVTTTVVMQWMKGLYQEAMNH